MSSPSSSAGQQQKTLWLFLGLTGALLIYRLAVSIYGGFNLGFDESYYWYWSQFPAFGYYSKPPMMAWLISLSTQVCGSSPEVCVRLPSLIAYPVSAFIIFLLGRMLFDARIGLVAAMIFLTMPGVALGNVLITTDAVLLLFWAASLYMLFRALESNSVRDWLILGICAGLGLLSKYTMVLFAPSVLLLLAVSPQLRSQLVNLRLYLAALIAFIVFLPNLLWNIENHFPTLHHTVEISHLEQAGLKFGQLGGFIAAQFGVFGPVAFAVLIGWIISVLRRRQDGLQQRLFPFTLVFLLVIALQALFGGANANWAAPAYIAASLIVAEYLVRNHQRVLLIALFVTNLLLGSAVYHFDQILELTGTSLTRSNDAHKALRGWQQMAEQVQPYIDSHPDSLLLGDSRHELAELIYYLRPHPLDAVKWNPAGAVKDHFDIVTTMKDKQGRNFIYVTPGAGPAAGINESFSRVERLADLHVVLAPGYSKDYSVFFLKDFQGYR